MWFGLTVKRVVSTAGAAGGCAAVARVLGAWFPAFAAAAGVGTAGEEQREYVDGEFANVYAFVTDPAGKSEDAPAVLFKRSAAEEWSLVSKPKVGPPRELLASDERPSAEAMRAALDASAAGGLLGAISSALGG